ncbi:MAG: sirohydrochlorin cobaltochelatase [Evtepia sp.]
MEDVLALVQAGSYERVVLQPLMIVAGDHANNDMAGDEDDSWKTTFEKAGYQRRLPGRGPGRSWRPFSSSSWSTPRPLLPAPRQSKRYTVYWTTAAARKPFRAAASLSSQHK